MIQKSTFKILNPKFPEVQDLRIAEGKIFQKSTQPLETDR